MVLKRGDSGDAVKGLQRNLNKLGLMLIIDGEFGQGTERAVLDARDALNKPGPAEADDALQQAAAEAPDPCPPLTAAGMTFIARQEVSSAGMYEKSFRKPCLPAGESGITIGIGYDLGQIRQRSKLAADWSDQLAADVIELLAGCIGRKGTEDLRLSVASVDVPLTKAMFVFAKRSIPEFLKITRSIYPQIDSQALTPAQRTALVSLVYNRGADLEGDRRREMKSIQRLLAAGRFDQVPAQFESMTRLFNTSDLRGVALRRQAEAALWRSGFASAKLD